MAEVVRPARRAGAAANAPLLGRAAPAGARDAAPGAVDHAQPAAAPAVHVPGPWAAAARTGILVAADLAALVLAGTAAYLLWAAPVHGQSARMYLELLPLLSLFVVGYAQAGLYPGFGLGPVETLRRCTLVTGTAFVVLAAFSFAFKVPHLYSRVTILIAGLLSLALIPVGRALVARLARRSPFWQEPVVVIGTGPRGRRAIDALNAPGSLGYRPAGVIALGPSAPPHVAGVPVLGDLEAVPRLARQGINVALVEAEDARQVELNWLRQHFRQVLTIRKLDDLPVEGLQIRNVGGVVAIEYTNNLLVPRNRLLKRAMDVAVASAGLAATSVLMVAGALAVKLVSSGPALFVQERIGRRGVRFRVPKLRTMHAGAAEDLERTLCAEPDLGSEWDRSFKLREDPRVVRGVGTLLRRFSIDELPQLWSVLKGDMSLVGPRPLPEYHLEAFPESFRRLRHRVRPGLTGLWQVSARGNGDPATCEALDTYYIHNWSPWLDLYILGRTVWAVLNGRGAY